MREKKSFSGSVLLFFAIAIFLSSCGQNISKRVNEKELKMVSVNAGDSVIKYKVTFIELGSVKCIPCQQMQAVMESIEAKYGREVKVEFHDVWTEAGKPFGVKYGIESIPTQVFLDETGKEYYRHVGFLPEEELVKILQQKGIKPV
jgi:thioredoxin 1